MAMAACSKSGTTSIQTATASSSLEEVGRVGFGDVYIVTNWFEELKARMGN
jgi:hypothetical protein